MKDFLLNEESGQGMVEYGLILALVAIVAVAALIALGGKVKDKFTTVNGALDQGTTAANEH